MIEISDPEQMRRWSRDRRTAGTRVALVPTMGYLHEGHLSLVERAHALAQAVVVSVFVNPLQFGPHEDFDRYPRDPERDGELALERGVDCLFVPSNQVMYPATPAVRVTPGSLAAHLCGPRRPGHFEGVLTVVAKLLHMVEPDVAVFGRKDAQQAIIIRRMVSELDFPVAIEVAPTVREPDGLALSSRNAYLSEEERLMAPAISRGLESAHRAFEEGERSAERVTGIVREEISREPLFRVEYVDAVDPVSLSPVSVVDADTIVAVAAHIGATRLIDNIVLGQGTEGDPRLQP